MNEEKKYEQYNILNQFGPLHGNVEKQEIHAAPLPVQDAQEAEPTETEKPEQLTNRQVVIFATSLLGITLDSRYTNQMQLSRLLSQLTGKSAGSLRQSIMKYAKEGICNADARKDAMKVADIIEPFNPDLARRIRNDAAEL